LNSYLTEDDFFGFFELVKSKGTLGLKIYYIIQCIICISMNKVGLVI
jgi:hypothetical protein